jgi:N-acetyltransferase
MGVRLEPLSTDHLAGLAAVGLEPEIWQWMPSVMRTSSDLRRFIEEAQAGADTGRELPFAIVERVVGQPVGSTRFLNIEPVHRRLEIGYTWLAPRWQRTAVNSEAKLLLLEHAFERLGALRVEFKTDARNVASRRALLGIGAIEEGTLRSHMFVHAGRRDSVYFSVIAEEWPRVRDGLERRLALQQRSTM